MAILGSLVAPNRETSRLAAVTFTVAGFAFSGYLIYRELFSINAICKRCASNAVIVTSSCASPSGCFPLAKQVTAS
jgi:uncharacterized membrane protein